MRDREYRMRYHTKMTTDTSAPISLEDLAPGLVWRMGKDEVTDQVIIRVGFFTSTPRFAEYARLKTVQDHELSAAMAEGTILIEWID